MFSFDFTKRLRIALWMGRWRWRLKRRAPRIAFASLAAHPPVDVAHWTPNMPRGAESRRRGSDRVTNADDVAG